MPEYYKTDKGYCYKKTKRGASRISVKEYDNAMKNKRKIKQKGGTLEVCTGNIQKLFGYFTFQTKPGYKLYYNNKAIDENKADNIFSINDKRLNAILNNNRINIPPNLNDLLNMKLPYNTYTTISLSLRTRLPNDIRIKIKQLLPNFKRLQIPKEIDMNRNLSINRGLPVIYHGLTGGINKNYKLHFYTSDIHLSKYLPELNYLKLKIKHILILWIDDYDNIEQYETIVIEHPNGLFEIFKDFLHLLKVMIYDLPIEEKTCIQFNEFRPYLYGKELNVFSGVHTSTSMYDRIIDRFSIYNKNLTPNLFKDKKYEYPFTGSTFFRTEQYISYYNNNNLHLAKPKMIGKLHRTIPYTREYLQVKRKRMKEGNNGVKNTKTFDSIRILNYYYILFENY
tara:strand:- start:1822 stop:3006 length:1185 start_codon:yes stop_codon:yes gene_type:complete